jgi:hypothetical protein
MVYNSIMDTGHAPKNQIKPHIIKGFFTEEELEVILAIVKYQKNAKNLSAFHSPLILPDLSRMQIELMYPPSIQAKLEAFASDMTGEQVFMSHNSYLSYTKEHDGSTNPKLPVHYDSDNYFTKLTLDYQLYANIDWPIVIENESFNLQYGDLLVFWGAGQVHWREPVLFKEGDITEVLTMHFSTIEDFEKLNNVSRDPEKRKERLATWQADPVFAQYNKDFFEKEDGLLNFKVIKKGN